jgi:maltooligosyltrehalose trehalohydrolase
MSAPDASTWRSWVKRLLDLRRTHLMPRLTGAVSIGAGAIGESAVIARWRLADGAVLTIASNLGPTPTAAQIPDEAPFFGEAAGGSVPAHTTLAWVTA